MKTLVLSTLAILVSQSHTFALEIRKCTPTLLEAETFQRISEFFSGKENPGKRLIGRTQADNRAGCYFILTLDQNVRELPENLQVKVELVPPAGKKIIVHTIPLNSEKPNTKEIYAGLTGSDAPTQLKDILAWRVSILDGTGASLVTKQSFLWSK